MPRRPSRVVVLVLTILCALVGPPATLAANEGSADQTTSPNDLAKVIVTYKSRPNENDVSDLKGRGARVKEVFSIITGVAASLPSAEVAKLKANPRVLRVEPDVALEMFAPEEAANAWGVTHIGAPEVHANAAGNTGTGVKIAVIDSGIAISHPDLNANYAGGWNFLNNTPNPADDNGHGTHVAGIIAAEANNVAETQAALSSNGVLGVAPDARIYALKVVDASGNGDYSGLIAALQWSVLNGIQVINISLGAHVDTQALHDAVAAASNAGIVVVAASGNAVTFEDILYGCDVAYPAAYPEAIAVSSVDRSDTVSWFSCTGPQVFVGAPGDGVTSTVPTGSCIFCSSSGYGELSGTSMASPHVAGLAVLAVKHGLPDVNGNGRINDEVAQQLCATATDAAGASSDPDYSNQYGCGVANAFNAVVASPFASTGSPPSAAFSLPAPGATVSTTETTNTVTWTQNAAGSGIWHQGLTQERGQIVTPGTCDGVTWVTRWTASYSSPFTTGGYAPGYCYRYTVAVTNGAGGTTSATSGNLLIVPPPPPPQPSASFTSPAEGQTIATSNTTNTVTWTESDSGGGGITSRTLTQERGQVVTPGTCAGVTWVTRWSASYTSPFTTGGYLVGYCYRYTVSVTNSAGGTASASSGNLLIESPPPPPPPSASFTSPILGETITTSSTTNTVTWTESGGDGGAIVSRTLTQERGQIVTPGTCDGVTWVTRWTASYSSPFTTGGYKIGFCYRFRVTVTNAAGGVAEASSGYFLITKK